MNTEVTGSAGPSGRDRLVRGIVDAISDPAGPRAVLILGAGGTGLSTALKQVCREFGEDRAWFAAARPRQPRSALGAVLNGIRAFSAPEQSAGRSAMLAIDDAQWIDADTLGRLVSLVRLLIRESPESSPRCVCAVRVDLLAAGAGRDLIAELVEGGLVEVVWLRPIDEAGLAAFIGERTGAEPTAELVRHVGRLSRNRPKAAGIVLDALTAADGIRIDDLRAHLVDPPAAPILEPRHRLVQELRGLGASGWSVAKAVAVLSPLGDGVPELVAEATGLPHAEVATALNVLRTNGIVRYGRTGGRWRFRLPLVQRILIGETGPYERRRLAQVAVTAVWEQRARCADLDYLADQQACAGRMLDEQRAKTELLAHARASIRLGRAAYAGVWLRAAAELSYDVAERVEVLWEYAQLCAAQGGAVECLAAIESLLSDLAVHPGPSSLLIDIHLTRAFMLRRTGNVTELTRLARGESWPWPADPVVQAVAKAGASYALGQWRRVRDLLDGVSVSWQGDSAHPAHPAEALYSLAALWQGEPDRFAGHLSDRDGQDVRSIGALLTLGDLRSAERISARNGTRPEQLTLADQAVLAARRGEYDRALEFTRSSLAPASTSGPETSRVSMIQSAALILLARGRLTDARALVERGHGDRTALVHLLAVPQARAAMLLGERQQADQILDRAIKDAWAADTVVGTDELWFTAAQSAAASESWDRIGECLRAADTVARRLATDRAMLHSMLIRACVEPRSCTAALCVARGLGQPSDLATAIEHLVRVGAGDPGLLREAYDLLGPADALLTRARIRILMRERDVVVPDRQAGVEENERLLAVLIAQGFGNNQLAVLLGVSRRSIENRLSRFFSRSGYRSRLELAMDVLRAGPELPRALGANSF